MSTTKITQGWKDLNIKDKLQYSTAIVLILSGIIIAFLSFFLTYDIAAGTLIYIAQAFTAGGALMGISIYFRDKLKETEEQTFTYIKDAITNALNKET